MASERPPQPLKIVPALLPVLDPKKPSRYRVAFGGRGSGKSWSFARVLIGMSRVNRIRILCTREVQKSIRDSVHRLLGDQIELLGLSSEFEILRDEIKHRVTGSQFLFAGLANTTIDNIKSYEGVDYCWVEEAQSVSARSWEILIPTIRKKGSEIWVTFNPNEATDPTYQRFVADPPPNARVLKVNWDQNRSCPAELLAEKDYLYRVDPEAAEHVWGGNPRRMSDAQVLRGRYTLEDFIPVPGVWDGPYQGADWGFAVDPSALVRVWIWERRLYVEHEAYGLGVEIDHTPALFDGMPGARDYVTRADNSRPETISYMVRAGFGKLMACKKWPGCVEDRVQYLRSFDGIVIHPRCTHTAEEARLWSFKTDRLSGDVLPQLLDKHNHVWDAVGYALEPMVLGHLKDLPEPEVTEDEFFGRASGLGWRA